MEQSKKEFLPVLQGVKLSKTQSPTTAEDRKRMKVISKEARRRDLHILRVFGEAQSSGPERNITPEAEWMAKQGFKWTDSDEDIEEDIPAAESDKEHWDDFSA